MNKKKNINLEVKNMTEMYCEVCKRNVLTKRKDFSLLTAFLLSFTGIGLVIYILYYFDQKRNRCIHCDTICQPKKLITVDINSENQLENNPEPASEFKPLIPKFTLEKSNQSFCSSCGVKFDDRPMNYCTLCGVAVD